MSYDLSFTRATAIPLDAFVEHFEARPNYAVDGQTATYENSDTGVYFHFECYADAEQDEEGGAPHVAYFNINYFRSHVFGLEAEPEVTAFVERFGVGVSDPQIDGMDQGPYTPEGFLKGWNHGNRFAVRAIMSGRPGDTYSMPRARMEALWRWIVERGQHFDELGVDIYVPLIFLFVVDGELKTGVGWPDGVSILMPEVDVVLLRRDRLAPRKWFFFAAPDQVLVERTDLMPILEGRPTGERHLPFHRLEWDEPPEGVAEFIRALPAQPLPEMSRISLGEVLPQELFG